MLAILGERARIATSTFGKRFFASDITRVSISDWSLPRRIRAAILAFVGNGTSTMPAVMDVRIPAPPMPRGSQRRSGYIQTLDGWRTIAVWAVIFYHRSLTRIGPLDLSGIHSFCHRGVDLFFAISGILICSRLLEEQRLNGTISLKNFYIRRVFRIQPAAVAFLVVAGSLGLAGVFQESIPAWVASLFCYRNFYAAANGPSLPGDAYTAHFWSLAVEEHFYLVLPALLIFARTRLIQALGFLSLVFFIWTVVAIHFHILYGPLMSWRTDICLANLLIPAFLAVLVTRPRYCIWLTRISSHGALLAAITAAILLSQFTLRGHFLNEICSIGFPLVVASTMLHPEGWLGRLLETRLFTFGGRISFSLYLWQQLPWNLLAVIGCAIFSYYFIEKRFMRLGHRLAPPSTPGRGDL